MMKHLSEMHSQNIHVKNSRVFRELFRSFLSLVILPLAVLCIDFARYRQILKNEFQSYEYALLEQAQMATDERLESVCQLAISFSVDSDICRFVSDSSMSQADINYTALDIMSLFSAQRSIYASVEDIILYSSAANQVVTSQNATSLPLDSYNMLGDEELNTLLSAYFSGERMYCEFVDLSPGGGQSNTLFLLHSIPLWSTGVPAQGTLAIRIDTENLFENFESIEEWQAGVVALVDDSGNVLAYMGDSALLAESLGGESIPSGDLIYEGERYYASSAASRLNGWQYLSIQSQSPYLSQLYSVLGSHVIILLLVVALHLLISWMLSWRNYAPVSRIMKALHRDLSDTAQQDDLSEYHIIERSLESLSQSINAMQDTLEQEIPKIQEKMLCQWLDGTITDYPAYRETLTEIGILMPYPAYAVLHVEITDYPAERTEDRVMLRAMARSRVVQCLPDAVSYGAADTGEDGFTLLLNARDLTLANELVTALRSAVNLLRTELLLTVWAGLGEPTTEMEEIPLQNFRLNQLFHHCKAEKHTGLELLKHYPESSTLYYCPESLLHHISNKVSLGSSGEVLQIIRENYQRNFQREMPQIDLVRSYFYLLIDAVLQGLPTQDEAFSEFWSNSSPMTAMGRANTSAKMMEVLEQFVCDSCRFAQSQRKSQADVLKQNILDYLNQNYADNGLSLSSVAEHFQITPNYLSTFFRENTGETFLNYLTMLRIGKAKSLLQETGLTISEISERVGYSGSNTFIRNYKKLEHITPGEYRRLLQNHG